MIITQGNDYAIRSLIFLSKQPKNKFISTYKISKKLKIPQNFLSKIFQKLTKKGIISTVKGSKGGVILSRDANEITLKEIFRSVDGLPVMCNCILDRKVCFLYHNCRLNILFSRIQSYLDKEFSRITIADLK